MVASLDPMTAVFAEVAKGRQAINMALLPITPKNEPGYLVERVEKVEMKQNRFSGVFSKRSINYILHLRIRGKKVKVWSRSCIDDLIEMGFDVAKLRAQGKNTELRVFSKKPSSPGSSFTKIEAALKPTVSPQTDLFGNTELERHTPRTYWDRRSYEDQLEVEERIAREEQEMEENFIYSLDKPDKEEKPQVDPYIMLTHDPVEDEDEPETIRIVDRTGSRNSTRWAYIDFDTNEEFTLSYHLDLHNQTLPNGQGIIQLINSQTPLRGARTSSGKRSHKKPDNVVIYTKDGNQVVALIEVDGNAHDGRYRQDAERETMFHNDGVMTIIRVSNEEIKNDPKATVQRIVDRLEQVRRTGIKVDNTTGLAF